MTTQSLFGDLPLGGWKPQPPLPSPPVQVHCSRQGPTSRGWQRLRVAGQNSNSFSEMRQACLWRRGLTCQPAPLAPPRGPGDRLASLAGQGDRRRRRVRSFWAAKTGVADPLRARENVAQAAMDCSQPVCLSWPGQGDRRRRRASAVVGGQDGGRRPPASKKCVSPAFIQSLATARGLPEWGYKRGSEELMAGTYERAGGVSSR